MLHQPIYAAAAWPAAQAGPQLGQIFGRSRGYHLHFALFGVAHPAAQIQLAGLPLHKPAEAHALHTALNQKMKNHR